MPFSMRQIFFQKKISRSKRAKESLNAFKITKVRQTAGNQSK
jgi:hypothetical protein